MASECKYQRLTLDEGGDIGAARVLPIAEEFQIFETFKASSNKELLEELRNDLRGLHTSVGFGLFLLRFQWCNAKYSTSFSNAFCHVDRQTDIKTQERVVYSFSSIFRRGCDILESFLNDSNSIPERKGEKVALAKLLSLLMDLEATSRVLTIDHDDKISEMEWTIRLAHHFLSKLAVNPSYILDKHYAFKRKDCPCCNEQILGTYEDTSIGSKAGWHGFIDIVLGTGKDLPIKIATKEPDSPRRNQSSIEIKAHDELKNSRSQVLAETVVFSFMQKKCHPEYDNFLIPTIAISRKQVGFYLYDCDHDMLMETRPVPLLKNEELFIPTILALWLTINYRYFCSGITEGMQERKFISDFYRQIEGCFEVYQKDVRYACGAKRRDEDSFEDFGLKLEDGKPAKRKEKS